MPFAPKPSRRYWEAEDSPRSWFLPTVAGPRRPPRPPRSARRAPPVAAREWSGPSVAATPFGSDSCSSCSGWSARAPSRGCLGLRAGGGEHRTTSAGCGARGQPPAGNREAEGPQRDRLQPGGEDQGWAFLTPVSTCCPAPSRPPFTAPTRPRYRPPPGTVIALGTLAPAGAAEPGAATVRTNDSAPFVPRERFGRNGGGWWWGGEVSCCALTSVSRLQRYHPGGRCRVG